MILITLLLGSGPASSLFIYLFEDRNGQVMMTLHQNTGFSGITCANGTMNPSLCFQTAFVKRFLVQLPKGGRWHEACLV